MLWTRSQLKWQAKNAFKKNYWRCVLAALILGLLVYGAGGARLNVDVKNGQMLLPDPERAAQMIQAFLQRFGGFLAAGSFLGIILGIFVFSVLEVGGCRFFIENGFGPVSVDRLLHGFRNGNYWNIVATQFFRGLFTFLWSLLFIIPGIVKAYQYRMIPYLLADDPKLTQDAAFAISKEMMTGQKWDAFVLDLSFIGWNILSAASFGLVGLFWSNPYQHATNAELYNALKTEYFRRRGA